MCYYVLHDKFDLLILQMHQSMKWINEIHDRFFHRAMKLLIERCHIGPDRYNCGQLSMFPFAIDWICGGCSTQKTMPYQCRCEWYNEWFKTPTLNITQTPIVHFYRALFINYLRDSYSIFSSASMSPDFMYLNVCLRISHDKQIQRTKILLVKTITTDILLSNTWL